MFTNVKTPMERTPEWEPLKALGNQAVNSTIHWDANKLPEKGILAGPGFSELLLRAARASDAPIQNKTLLWIQDEKPTETRGTPKETEDIELKDGLTWGAFGSPQPIGDGWTIIPCTVEQQNKGGLHHLKDRNPLANKQSCEWNNILFDLEKKQWKAGMLTWSSTMAQDPQPKKDLTLNAVTRILDTLRHHRIKQSETDISKRLKPNTIVSKEEWEAMSEENRKAILLRHRITNTGDKLELKKCNNSLNQVDDGRIYMDWWDEKARLDTPHIVGQNQKPTTIPLGLGVITAHTQPINGRPTLSREQLRMEDSKGINGWAYAAAAGRIKEAISIAPKEWEQEKERRNERGIPKLLEILAKLGRIEEAIEVLPLNECAKEPAIIIHSISTGMQGWKQLEEEIDPQILIEQYNNETAMNLLVTTGNYANVAERLLTKETLTAPSKLALGKLTYLDRILTSYNPKRLEPKWIEWASKENTPIWEAADFTPQRAQRFLRNIPADWLASFPNGARKIAEKADLGMESVKWLTTVYESANQRQQEQTR